MENKLKNQPCYDKDGNLLGWFSRSVAVAGFIFCRNSDGVWCVLGSERGKGTPDFQGYWNCVCGYCEFDLTVAENLVKEVLEETGIKLSADQFTFIGYEDSPTANHQNITFRFGCKIDYAITDIFTFSHEYNEKDEVGDIKWIPLSEVLNYKWAFGHEERIFEVAKTMGII